MERTSNIIEEYRTEIPEAINEDLGTEDLKRGHKELTQELKTKDIKWLFNIKNLFKK
jgi:hypothetical protein